MKRINLIKRFKKQPSEDANSGSGRITNETVAEHRERVLAGGRKFKYPLQHNKRRIVINSIIIVFIATILLVTLCWWQLYPTQNTSKFMYRITQIIPFPVARVDGSFVPYAHYFMELRSAIHYLETKEAVNFSSDDGKRQLEYQKRLALNKTLENALAAKLAHENGVQITNKDVDDFVKTQIQSSRLGVSEEVYRKVIEDYYDWSFSEYKQSIHNQLLRKKVVAKIDAPALKLITDVSSQVKAGGDFAKLAQQHSEDTPTKANGGDLGLLPKTSDDPNGLLKAAASLQPGQVSEVITGVDGYYLVKLQEQKESEVRISKIFIAYKEFDQRLAKLKANKKIDEYIKIPDSVQPIRR